MFLFQEGHNTSGESEQEIPKYISDVTDMSNYVRGRFLGKVGHFILHHVILDNQPFLKAN